jgi:hypothetical protein
MHRISVVGNSGSGKTSLARSIAEALAVPHLELDAIHHQPGWTPLSDDQFRQVVSEFVAQGDWVVDGNYSLANDLVWALADTVVWLDFPRLDVIRKLSPAPSVGFEPARSCGTATGNPRRTSSTPVRSTTSSSGL